MLSYLNAIEMCNESDAARWRHGAMNSVSHQSLSSCVSRRKEDGGDWWYRSTIAYLNGQKKQWMLYFNGWINVMQEGIRDQRVHITGLQVNHDTQPLCARS